MVPGSTGGANLRDEMPVLGTGAGVAVAVRRTGPVGGLRRAGDDSGVIRGRLMHVLVRAGEATLLAGQIVRVLPRPRLYLPRRCSRRISWGSVRCRSSCSWHFWAAR
jgi:hypothetical protein